MIFSMGANARDKECTKDNTENCSFDDLCELVKNPFQAESYLDEYGSHDKCKLEQKCFIPWRMESYPSTFNKNNVKSFDTLFLDYDGTESFKAAYERFKEYDNVMHTSYTHKADGKTNKFRIIIPLDKSYPADTTFNNPLYVAWMKQFPLFMNADEKTFKVSIFFAPVVNSITNEYKHWINKTGKRLSLDDLYKDYSDFVRKDLNNVQLKKERYFDGQGLCVRSFKFNTPIGERSVNDWLSINFKSRSGNQWSEIGLFQCFRLCKRYNDNETKVLIWTKAKNEGWTEQELTRKWNDIKEK